MASFDSRIGNAVHVILTGSLAGATCFLFLCLTVPVAGAEADEPDSSQLEHLRQTSLLVRPFELPESPPSRFDGGFHIEEDSTIALLGGTNAVDASKYAYLETLLSAASPNHCIRFRNMGWQADTIFRQQRPRHFYQSTPHRDGELDGRKRVRPDLILLWMGQSESLEGLEQREKFYATYKLMVQLLQTYTGRIVLITPVPFENPLGLAIDIEQRNQTLSAYVDVIKQIGEEENVLVVDLFGAMHGQEEHLPLTSNGVHLNAQGHWLAAWECARQLGFADLISTLQPQWPSGALVPEAAEETRQLAMLRSAQWYRYWRPTNWAFLYGNRQNQPSSRDHQDRGQRWFPDEIELTLPLLEEADQAVYRAAGQLSQ